MAAAIAAVLHLAVAGHASEAWNFCMRTAGGSTPRRVVFRAAGVGALASVLSAQLGVATRIGALRRTAPHDHPAAPALVAAEVPIVAVEATLAALFTFTLIGPLNLPPWTPAAGDRRMIGVLLGLRALARRRRSGLLARPGRGARAARPRTPVALVVLGILAQIARNWLCCTRSASTRRF